MGGGGGITARGGVQFTRYLTLTNELIEFVNSNYLGY